MARRTTKFLRGEDYDNLAEAVAFAETIGRPLNRTYDIAWGCFAESDLPDDRRLARAQERMSKWLRRRGHELFWLWVREGGCAAGTRPHVHILAHLPVLDTTAETKALQSEFRTALEHALEHEGEIINRLHAIDEGSARTPAGKLGYLAKGLSLADWQARGIKHEHKPQGPITGKRCGMTANLNRAARRRWSDGRASATDDHLAAELMDKSIRKPNKLYEVHRRNI